MLIVQVAYIGRCLYRNFTVTESCHEPQIKGSKSPLFNHNYEQNSSKIFNLLNFPNLSSFFIFCGNHLHSPSTKDPTIKTHHYEPEKLFFHPPHIKEFFHPQSKSIHVYFLVYIASYRNQPIWMRWKRDIHQIYKEGNLITELWRFYLMEKAVSFLKWLLKHWKLHDEAAWNKFHCIKVNYKLTLYSFAPPLIVVEIANEKFSFALERAEIKTGEASGAVKKALAQHNNFNSSPWLSQEIIIYH
jgi:hypothetical protein